MRRLMRRKCRRRGALQEEAVGYPPILASRSLLGGTINSQPPIAPCYVLQSLASSARILFADAGDRIWLGALVEHLLRVHRFSTAS